MKKKLLFIFHRKKILLCFSLMLFSMILLCIIFIVKPTKINESYTYNARKKTEKTRLQKKVVQKFKINTHNISGLYVYFEDDSVLDCNFHVELVDDKNNKYLDNDIKKYQSNILYLSFSKITNVDNSTFELKIDFENCNEVYGMVAHSIDKNNYLVGTDNKSLKIVVNSVSNNYSYYWYVAVMMCISLILLPLAWGEEWKK